MSMVSSDELAAMEQQIDARKTTPSSKSKSFRDRLPSLRSSDRLASIRPKFHPLSLWYKRKARGNDTYRKLAAVSAVASAYTDAELQKHMIASGLPDYPDPASNVVAQHLARTHVATDLMDRVYPREAAHMAAISAAFPENPLPITADGDSSSDDWDDDLDLDVGAQPPTEWADFEMAVADNIQTVCDTKEAAVLDAETRELMSYASSDPAAQEAALLEALRRDKDREATHVAADSEVTADKLEGIFKDTLPAELKGDLKGAAADAFHVALVDELNKASLTEIRNELTSDADRAHADAADAKNMYMVTVLEDQKPASDELAMQRKSRRLKDAYAKLRGYVSKFGQAKRARLTELFGRMSRFVRAIPESARKRPFMRHYLSAMAVAASLSTADLQAYDTAGVLDTHPEHPYAQHLIRQRITADLMAMSDVHGARYMADLSAHVHDAARTAIGAAVMEIGLSSEELRAVRLRPVSPAPSAPAKGGDDLQSVLSRGLANVRRGVAPEEEDKDEMWDAAPPELKSENATVVPLASPEVVATVVAREEQATADVDVVVKETDAVIATVQKSAETAAVKTTAAALDSVPPADAAAVPDSVLLAFIATNQKVIEKEEFDKLQATIKDAAQRKANEQLRAQVASLERLLKSKASAPVAPNPPAVGVPNPPSAAVVVPDVVSLPTDAAAVIADTREERVDKVEEAMETASTTKKGAALSFFREIMGSTGRGTAGFLKDILPTLGETASKGAADVLPGVTSAGIESLGNVGLSAATTYADRRAAKNAAASESMSFDSSPPDRSDSKQGRREERQANREQRSSEKQERREARQKGREERAAEKQERHEEREARRKGRREKREGGATDEKPSGKTGTRDVATTKRREERQARREGRDKRRAEKQNNADAKAKRHAERQARREGREQRRQANATTAPAKVDPAAAAAKAQRREARQARKVARNERRQARAAGTASSSKPAKGTYATKAEKRAAMDKARAAKYGAPSAKQTQRRAARRAARDQDKATRKANKPKSKSGTKKSTARTSRAGVMPKGAAIPEPTCSMCNITGPMVTPIGCASCGTRFDSETSSSSNMSDTSSVDDTADYLIGEPALSSTDWTSSTSSSSSDVSTNSSDTSSENGDEVVASAKSYCMVRDPDDDRFECKSCGVRSKALCSGKFCKVCLGRTDGCDRCAACNDTGCSTCFATSPAARLAVYRRQRGFKAKTVSASIGASAVVPECMSCGASGVDVASATVCKRCTHRTDGGASCPSCKDIGCATCRANAPRRVEGHLCYGGEKCGVCELRRKYAKTKTIGDLIPVTMVDSNSAVVLDPLGGSDLEVPVFALNAWGFFMLVRSTYPILQQNVEGDWQFPPSASAVRVLSLLQRSPRGAEHAMMVMDRLCLFLQFAPRMNPALAPGAVELAHRLAEARVPTSMPLLDTPFTQDEIEWTLAGIGLSFRALQEAQMWTFVYEMIVGLRATYDKAGMMYDTILSYSPLMSMVEAKKFRDANASRDPYAAIASKMIKT